MKLSTRLWLSMGLMTILLLIIGLSHIYSNHRISREVDGIATISYPLALSSMNLQIQIERSLGIIRLAATAGRTDLLKGLSLAEAPVEKYLNEILSNQHASPQISEVCAEVRSRYLLTKDIGLQWVDSTIQENWDIEPQLAGKFNAERHHLLGHISEIKIHAVNQFSSSIEHITGLADSVQDQTLIIFLVGLGLFLVMTIRLYQSITIPLNKLLIAINQAAKVKIQPSSGGNGNPIDEINRLGLAFNQMIDKLDRSKKEIDDHTKKLEFRVKERTRELYTEKEALLESERNLKTIWDSTPTGLMVIDKETHQIVDANPFALKLLGWSLAEVVGHECHKFVCPAEQGRCPITDLKQEIDGAERVLVGRSGKQIPILKTVVSFKKKDREYLIESFADITDRKEAEERIEIARNEAETANRAKSDFLANMSHELRTPLNHIIGFTEMVADENFGKLNSTQKDFLDDVLRSSQHLLSLINDILDISKVEAGKMELQVDRVELPDLIRNSLVMVKEKALKNTLRITADIERLPAGIHADGRKLKQVMYNLLSNAVKFTPKQGTIEVIGSTLTVTNGSMRAADGREIQLPAVDDPEQLAKKRSFAQIMVQDTGIGLASDNLERIFSTFDQVESSISRQFQGTGLGLALSKQFVELHGGAIWAESEGESKGSRVIFLIPVNGS